MEHGVYKIADTVFALKTLYADAQEICRGYQCAEEPAFTLETATADIAYERRFAEGAFSDAYLERLAVLRKLSAVLLDRDILLFHGSALAMDGEAYLFTAPSGTGKSTHARLWREEFGSRVRMINDDKPFVKVTSDGVWVYGSPWNGKHRLSTNTAAPLKAICLLQRGEKNEIAAVSPTEAFPVLMTQCHCPADPASTARVMHLIKAVTKTVGLYRLRCNREPEAARIAWRGMSGQNGGTAEDELRQNGVLVTASKGRSMLPLIRSGRDLLEIRGKGAERLHRYDIALFRRNGEYVLHRVVAVGEQDYTFRGDNALRAERGIKDADILGVLHSIQRSGKRIQTDSIPLKIYAAVWCLLYPVRAIYLRLRQLAGRIRRRTTGERT